MQVVKIKVVNNGDNELPAYATEESSGMDLRANLDAAILIEPFDRVLVPTGLFLEIPSGYEGQVRPRSGLAIKKGLTVLNTPGTIDADYRGEVKVILVNLSKEKNSIEPGERIAQIVFQKVERAELVASVELEDTKRGTGGFGHSGVK